MLNSDVRCIPDKHDYDDVMIPKTPNARIKIMDAVFKHECAWENSTSMLIAKAKIKKAGNNKFAKTRVAIKTTKQTKRMNTENEELGCDAGTMYRTLSARLLHLPLDRPECTFASKQLRRHSAHPIKAGVDALKRAALFILGMPRFA